jgi:hypothetical protein
MENDIFKILKSTIKDKLLLDLKKDFKHLSEDELLFFINKRLNEDKDWDHNNQLQHILKTLFTNDDRKTYLFKQRLSERYGQDKLDNYYILIEFVKNIFKTKTTIILDNMDFIISEKQFENVYQKVFRPYQTIDNKEKLKQKKFRLKKKLCKGCVTKEQDYECILFRFIVNNPI